MADTTSRTLRSANRSRVLSELVRVREATRSRLAAACRLSPATITNVVADLLREGLVEERGVHPSDGGRPVVRLGLRPAGAFVLGADVGERGVAVELFDLTLERIDREFREIGEARRAEPAQIGQALTAAVNAVLQRNPQVADRLVGLGLGLPGVVEDVAGGSSVLHAQSLGWPAVQLDELVAVEGLEVFAENGAKALATAEMWFGAAQGVDHAVVALLGRGVGLGIVSDGRLLRGSTSSAGEWGHTKLVLDGRACRCSGRGCLEAYVGADGLLERWRDLGGDPPGAGWTALTALVAAADAGEASAVAVLDEALDVLALALANLVNLLNPRRVIVGGWVGLCLMQARGPELQRRTRAASLARPGSQFELRTCHFGGDSVALGAALLPLERLIERPLLAEALAV